MTPSSSSSWTGAGGGADIIDLDRYMRGNVRPSRALSEETQPGEQLVVDGGGIGRKLAVDTTSVRYKRYSQDSGVSDGSYVQRRVHRPHRRTSNTDGPRHEHNPQRVVDPPTSSLQDFRKTCEQALLDQQKQIARVTQLCELLTEKAEKVILPEKIINNESANEQVNILGNRDRPSERPTDVKQAKPAREHIVRKVERVSSDTSDITSSSCSRSTKDLTRKEKHRTQECKTYKIIMTKLDELNRRFVPPRPGRPAARPRPPSSTSVSVCDKLVATDPQRTVNKVLWPTNANFMAYRRQSSVASSRPRVVTEAYNVDIAPKANVITESVVKSCASSCGSAVSIADPRCGFDLEDPVHFYSQVKRLQALNATTRRARSVATRSQTANDTQTNASPPRARSPSLCSVCRGYWRSLRQCLIPLFAQDCTA